MKKEKSGFIQMLFHTLPFKLGKEKRIAVKVIDHRGNEVMVVREIG